ncbi:cell division protein FtsL [Paenibacillus sp. V4I3]|uniref:hypothetical protein n=1 Tax=Paenibacillus sp. V4I3 TaxID=3042305 RepID=UPI002785C304|nr:hypothetical protein [Paenibacillus sp. V4I3]MDQ0878881.1 cell division protein FtsL [Paenibacillus sp. V4I3]
MENQLELLKPEQIKIKRNKKVIVLNIVSASLIVALSTSTLLLSNKFTKLEKSFSDMNNKYLELENKISDVSSKLPTVDLTKIDSRIESLDRRIYFMNMQHNIEGGLVTEDFIVQHAIISVLPSLKDGQSGILHSSIDLDTQPVTSSKYKGQGKFTVPDRELKSMLQDVIDKIQKRYDGSDQLFKGLPQWKDGTVYLTIKNYEIGTYKNGEIKLKGE